MILDHEGERIAWRFVRRFSSRRLSNFEKPFWLGNVPEMG
jgi:hypothetical protein